MTGMDVWHSRATDPATSHAAGEQPPARLSALLSDLLGLLGKGPGTHGEIEARYRAAGLPARTPQRIRTAVAALVRAGLVENTGQTRPTEYGRQAIVWGRKQARPATAGGAGTCRDAHPNSSGERRTPGGAR